MSTATEPSRPLPAARPPVAEPDGLTSEEARERLERFGPNEPVLRRPPGWIAQTWQFFLNPVVLILLAASLVAGALGEATNALIIALMIVLSVALNTYQTVRSTRAAERLRRLVAMTATTRRDGVWREVPRREVVPGDAVRLSAGDLVPADARLLSAQDLQVQEAALTGESLPVAKSPGADERLYLGTTVVSGFGFAKVEATGAATAFGDVARQLEARAPETEFDRGTRRFGLLILKTVVFLVLFVLAVNLILRRDPMESLLFSMALAVGLTPEFLPMITTVTLGQGAIRMAREKVIVKHLASLQNFGSIDMLLSDKTGTLTAGEMSLAGSLDAAGRPDPAPARLAALNSAFQAGIDSPLDAALLAGGEPADREGWRKEGELPFDFERRRVSVLLWREGRRVLIAKGAPEAILPLCTELAGAPGEPEAARRTAEATFRRLSEEGARVLAVASRDLPGSGPPAPSDESSLRLLGFVSFVDPPRADSAEMLRILRRDGVHVKILTGDNEMVARNICDRVGLKAARILRGEELDRISDSALGRVAERTAVFARISPRQKTRVLAALRARGHVVGFLGDGVNDAPSLRAADVGISVSSGVDVAREAAEVLLLDRGLKVLHDGVIEGRKAFGNVMKYLLMGTSSNFGNMFSMAAASLFLPFLPMLPLQILLNNFLYDLAQVTIPTDRVDAGYTRKPHRWDIRLIRDFMIYVGPVSSLFDFLTFYVLLRVFRASEALFHTGWFVESLATQTLVVFVIRTAGRPWKSRPSAALTATVLACVAAGVALPFTPLAATLGFVPLPGRLLALLLAMTVAYLAMVETLKRVLFRRVKLL